MKQHNDAVAVIKNRSGSIAGMGVLIDAEHVLTCAHVVNLALGREKSDPAKPNDLIELGFPLVEQKGEHLRAQVVHWLPMSQTEMPEDIAVLKLEEAVPASHKPTEFIEPAVGQKIRAFGFPQGSQMGNWHDGELKGILANGWVQIDDDNEIGIFLQRGFSATPVWDQSSRYAVGIAVAAEVAPAKQGVGYVIPSGLLKKAWENLTFASPVETVLRRYCDEHIRDWKQARTDEENPDKLTHYVEPRYALLKKGLRPLDTSSRTLGSESGEGPGDTNPYQDVATEGDAPLAELAKLLEASQRLCITEDAGAGKSIFTRRLQAFLCSPEGQARFFDGQPCLVVRWEPRVQSWPNPFDQQGLVTALANALRSAVEHCNTNVTSQEVAEWALRQRRVVLILDALDQATDSKVVDSLQESLHSGPARDCRIVLTSRSYAVADHQALFDETGHWRFGMIKGFDRPQQEEYLQGLYDERLEELFPEYEDVAELLRIPVVLAYVRELAEAGELKEFRSRGDLYLQVHEHFTTRAARKLGLVGPSVHQKMRWREILAATACEMMSREVYNYAVQGDDAVDDVQQGASARCGQPISPEEWSEVEKVSDLTDRCILEGASKETVCWKHRGMMEFYCGLHLAKNSQPGWLGEKKDAKGRPYPRCGDPEVRRRANDPNWYWAFRFAIEMNRDVWRRKSENLGASLSALFERPESGLRPNELIYRAWSLLERGAGGESAVSGGERILEHFRQEFQDLLEQQDSVAVELQSRFVRCPPKELGIDNQPFWMGTADADDGQEQVGDDDERPRHQVVVSPFHLQTTAVTRQQYQLYDQEHRRHYARDLDAYAPEPDCPVIYVSWYDAWGFASWIGGRLPTEAEWEYACRAGTRGRWHFGDDEAQLASFAWYDRNWGGRTRPVGQKAANAWGLYDMHGNVWEWVADWYDYDYYASSPLNDPTGPPEASRRVFRGGGWRFDAGFCRAAFRDGLEPQGRSGFLGFRVAAVPLSRSSQEPAAEPGA